MGFSPGRSVGRLSIRVVPDTTRFRRELKQQLDDKMRGFEVAIKVTKANLDRSKIREDIRRQMDSMKDFGLNVKADVKVDDIAKQIKDQKLKVTPTLDRLTANRLRKTIDDTLRDIEPELRPTLNDQGVRQRLDALRAEFDRISGELEHDILSPEAAERLRHRLNEIKDKIDEVAKDRDAHINANPFTAWAAARLKWLTRPRNVEIVVNINKQSLAAAATTLAALSGARLGGTWIEDIKDLAKDLDKNLPSILGWTTGVTTLFAGLAGGIGGLVGIGQGLFSITPALLTLPGLLLNAMGSLTVLIVALKNTSDELSVLKDDMTELGDIINETFWGRARKPITDLVQGLMPQLRNSFRELSEGVGDFVGEMANSFSKELGGGRLESIFGGIAEGWRILASGSDGFAGAIVSLSQIAATYTPRLAKWFVRQADTFDKWLTAISTDGRLGKWMEDAIDSMYDVWDVTRGVAGVFEGIWKAADRAGIGGLKEFADLMLEWERVANSPAFQKGLTGVFAGSAVAMSAVGDGIRAVGRLVSDLDSEFEELIGSSGKFIGGIVESVAEALNSPIVATGMTGLSQGLVEGLERIKPSLQPIADTFGGFLGLLGDLGRTVLPAAASVLAELMPSIDGIITAVEGVLPDLSSSVTDIAETLGPALASFVDDVAPVLGDVLVGVAEILEGLAPVIGSLLEQVGAIIGWLGTQSGETGNFFKDLAVNLTPDAAKWRAELQNVVGQLRNEDGWIIHVPLEFESDDDKVRAEQAAQAIAGEYRKVLEREGTAGAQAMLTKLGEIEVPESFASAVEQAIGDETIWSDMGWNASTNVGEGLSRGFRGLGPLMNEEGIALGSAGAGGLITGLDNQGPAAATSGANLGTGAGNGFVEGLRTLNPLAGITGAGVGASAGAGMASGANGKKSDMRNAGAGLMSSAKSGAQSVSGWYGLGSNIGAGVSAGINDAVWGIRNAAVNMVNQALAAAKNAADTHSPSRKARKEIGQMIGEGTALGMEDKRRRIADASRRSISAAFDHVALPNSSGRGEGVPAVGGSKTVNLTINNPNARDLKRDAYEGAQMAGVLL